MVRSDPKQFPRHVRIFAEGGLRTGLQAIGAGGEDDILDEHSVIDPGPCSQVATNEEEQPDRGIEEHVVAVPAFLSALAPFCSAIGPVHRYPERHAPALVRFMPLHWVILVIGSLGRPGRALLQKE